MSRNSERVLSDAMIFDIRKKMFEELTNDARGRYTVAETLMDAYLMNDKDGLMDATVALIESIEDDILLTLNMELKEESHDNVNI